MTLFFIILVAGILYLQPSIIVLAHNKKKFLSTLKKILVTNHYNIFYYKTFIGEKQTTYIVIPTHSHD
jgi:hypothetical protein